MTFTFSFFPSKRKRNALSLIWILTFGFFILSCSHMDYQKKSPIFSSHLFFKKILLNEKKKREREKEKKMESKKKGVFQDQSLKAHPENLFLKRLLHEFESLLIQEREKTQYYRFYSFMRNDKERLKFLMLPNFLERKRWLKAKGLYPSPPLRKEFIEVVKKGNVTLGMNQKEVKVSLGLPYKVGTAGQAFYKNEVWQYVRFRFEKGALRKRFFRIFFEKAVVIGWDWM